MMHMGLNSYEEHGHERGCKSVTRQRMNINTPIRLEPIVCVGNTTISCEEPKVCAYAEHPCKHSCEFVIRQTINIEIPIRYDVLTNIGDSFVDCIIL